MTTSERLLAAHLAYAISHYLPWARHNGLRPPVDELVALGESLVAASSGQQRPTIALIRGTPESGAVAAVLLSYADAAAALAVSERTVRRLVVDGRLPAVRIGGRSLIHRLDVEAYAASLRPHGFRGAISTKDAADASETPRRRRVVVHRRAG